jgi:hypothetical protein
MSLGYPSQTPLQYNPFLKTSFGFGANALQNLPNNPFPNATDYVRVVITVDDATHWDDSGHIQTEEVGTAVSIYSSETFTWEVDGERDDVETILAELVFYPPAYQPLTDWRPTEMKENVTDGNFTDEQPEDTAAVPNTQMEIVVYSSTNWVTAYDIYVEAVNPYYDNTRPYFSSSVQSIDVADSAFDNTQGELLPLELVVENTDDEEYLEVKAEFLRVSDGTQITENSFGFFTDYQDLYLGGKKGLPQNTTDKRFNFVGRKAECNTFLENLEFTTNPQMPFTLPADSSFFIRTSVSDGQIGSYIDTLIWHSDTTISWYGDLQSQSFIEDNSAYWDLGQIVFQNLDSMAEVDVYSAKVKLTFGGNSEVGYDDFYTSTTVDSQTISVDTSSGNAVAILTITDTNPNTVLTALRNLVFRPKRDFQSNFSLGLGFEFNSTVYGTTYSTSGYSTIVVNGANTPELSNRYLTFNTDEGVPFNINSGLYPQIVHPINDRFKLTLTFSNQNGGNLWSHNGGDNLLTKINSGVWEIEGSKSEVNFCLQNLYIYHDTYTADNDLSYTVNLTLDRLHPVDDQYWDPLETGTWTVNVTPTTEAEMATTEINYREDNTLYFNFGYDITDTASLYAQNGNLYNSQYRVEIRSFLMDGSGFIDIGSFTSLNTGSLIGYGGTTKNGGALYLQGYPSDIETALANMKFLPDVDEYDDFKVRLDLYRIADNKLLEMSQRTFRGTQVDDYQKNITEINWHEEHVNVFDSGIRITDEADENIDYTQYQSDYQVDLQILDTSGLPYSNAYSFKSVSSSQSLLTSYVEGVNTYQIIGSKSAINNNLQNLRFIAQVDEYDPCVIRFKITRLSDNVVIVDFSDESISFNGFGTPEFSFNSDPFSFYEDSYQGINLGLLITDLAPDNPDYPSNVRNTTYTVDFRLRYLDDFGNEQDFTDASILSWNTRGTYVSGGYPSNQFTITGSKDDINYTLENDIRIYGFPDVLGAPNSSGNFYVDFFVTRNFDNSTVGFPKWTNSFYNFVRKPILKSVNRPEFSMSTYTISMLPNTVCKFDINASIVDTADLIYETGGINASYTLEIVGWDTQQNNFLSSSEQLYIWTSYTNTNIGNQVITNNGTNRITITGNKTSINNVLNSFFLVATQLDSYNIHNTVITYKLSRTINGNTVVLRDFGQDKTIVNFTVNPPAQFNFSGSYYDEDENIVGYGSLELNERLVYHNAFYWSSSSGFYNNDAQYYLWTDLFDISEFPYPQEIFSSTYTVTVKFLNNNGSPSVKDITVPVSSLDMVTYFNEEILDNGDYLVTYKVQGTGILPENRIDYKLENVYSSIVAYPSVDYEDIIDVEININRDYNNRSILFDSFTTDVRLTHNEFKLSFTDDPIVLNEENYDTIYKSDNVAFTDRSTYLNNATDVKYKFIARLDYSGDKPHAYFSNYAFRPYNNYWGRVEPPLIDGSYFGEDYADFDDYVVNTVEVFWSELTSTSQFPTWQRINGKIFNLVIQGISDPNLSENDSLGTVRVTLQRYVGDTLDVTWVDDQPLINVIWTLDTNVIYNPDVTFSTPDSSWTKTTGTGVILTSDVDDITYPYLTITDAYQEVDNPSLYKVILTSQDTLTYYDSDGVEITNGIIDWDTKENINNRLHQGVTVYGNFDSTTTVDIEIQRQTNSGNEETIWTGTHNHIKVKRPTIVDYSSFDTVEYIDNTSTDVVELNNTNILTKTGPFINVPPYTAQFGFDYTLINGERKGNFDSHDITPTPPSVISFTRNPDRIETVYEMNVTSTDTEPRKFDFTFTGYNNTIQQEYNFKYRDHIFKDGGDREYNALWGYYDTSNSNPVLLYTELGASGLRFRSNPSYFSPASNFTVDAKKRGVSEYTSTQYPYQRYISGTRIEVGMLDDGEGGQDIIHVTPSPFVTTVLHNVPSSAPSNIEITQFEPDFYVVCGNLNNYTFYTQTITFVDTSTTPQTIVNINQTEITNYDNVRAMVSDDKNTIVVLKTDGVDNKFIVHGRNTGGTDNWGIVASDTFTSSESFLTEIDPLIYVEDSTTQEFFNGTDTVVTNSGRIYKKDHGGADNWGLLTTLKDDSGYFAMNPYICGITSENIFTIKYNPSTTSNEVHIYDIETGDLMSRIYDCGRFEEQDHVQVYGQGFYNGDDYGYLWVDSIPTQYQSNRNVISDIRYCKNNNVIYFTESNYAMVGLFSNTPSRLEHCRKQHLIKLAPK